MLKIKVKKIHADAVVPKYAYEGDAGMDIYSVSKEVTEDYIEYRTGICIEIPEGHVCLIFPRSSISKKDLSLCNSVGVLDSGYRGEIKFRFLKHGEKVYSVGERVGQIIILPYPKIEVEEVNELSETARGDGGFGSTGKYTL